MSTPRLHGTRNFIGPPQRARHHAGDAAFGTHRPAPVEDGAVQRPQPASASPRVNRRTLIRAHRRSRRFDTKHSCPGQMLDSDPAQVVVAGSASVFPRGQYPQALEGGAKIGAGDAVAQTLKPMQTIRQLAEDSGATMERVTRLVVCLTDIRRHPVCTGLVMALARPEWRIGIDAMAAVIPE